MAKTLAQVAQEFLRRPEKPVLGGGVPTSSGGLVPVKQYPEFVPTFFDEEERRREMEYKKLHAQMAMQNNAAMINHNHFGNAIVGAGGYAALGQQVYKPPPPTQEEEEAWSVPISTLCDMWEMRFGEAWVRVTDVEKNVMVYKIGVHRLLGLNKLEVRDRQFDGTCYRLVK